MRKKEMIPINAMIEYPDTGISVERLILTDAHVMDETLMETIGEGSQSHRHDSHSFHLLENGTITVEIDFQTYQIKSPSVIYVHPNQVHRTTAFEEVTVCSLAITNENLNADYLAILEDITPAKPLVLNAEMFSLLKEAHSLCRKFYERNTNRLYHSLLKDSCNALVALVLSQYLEGAKSIAHPSRFQMVSKTFRKLLEDNYAAIKRPAEYAQQLNISTAYLNECVKVTTGYPVSYHIQQRVILEAKRLLYYSGKSVKEIAAGLGYDDYPYFSRLFTKTTGTTAQAFRSKNRG